MSVRPRGLDDHTYRKRTATLRKQARDNGMPCWLCGKPIDFDLPYTHRMSFTADHIDPRGLGGKLLGEIRPAHRACNSSRGKRRTIEAIPKPVTTRAW